MFDLYGIIEIFLDSEEESKIEISNHDTLNYHVHDIIDDICHVCNFHYNRYDGVITIDVLRFSTLIKMLSKEFTLIIKQKG